LGLRLLDDGVSPGGCLAAGPTADPDANDALVSEVLGKPIYKPMEDFVNAIAPGDQGFRFGWDWRKAPSQRIGRLRQFVTEGAAHEVRHRPGPDEGRLLHALLRLAARADVPGGRPRAACGARAHDRSAVVGRAEADLPDRLRHREPHRRPLRPRPAPARRRG